MYVDDDNVAVIMIGAISQKWRMNDVSEDIALWCMATFYLLFPLWHLFTCYSHAMATFTCYYGLFRAHKMSCTQCTVRKVVFLWKKSINLAQPIEVKHSLTETYSNILTFQYTLKYTYLYYIINSTSSLFCYFLINYKLFILFSHPLT